MVKIDGALGPDGSAVTSVRPVWRAICMPNHA